MEPYVTVAATSRQLAIDPDCQDDPFYRYQTHQLVVDFQGKRARLRNLLLVAKNLQTSADYIATYLATSLNTAVKRSTAGQKQGGAVTTWELYPATFTIDKMNACFRTFLTSFIMCPSCSLPELINLVDQEEEDSPSSPPPSEQQRQQPKRKAKKAAAAKGGDAAKVNVRCQGCGWNEPLEKRMRRVANTKFADYVLAHPPQETSASLLG